MYARLLYYKTLLNLQLNMNKAFSYERALFILRKNHPYKVKLKH